MSKPFHTPAENGVRVFVRLTPKAGRESIQGFQQDASGQTRLKVAVTAVPEKGKANAALVKLLAKRLKVAKSALTITAGETDRNKVLHVAGDGVEDALKALIEA